ncbi:hypothetical protein K1719_012847 [Acacia pycnantha]|nr:hypothetical protein K1719_012847 [Acacia pycnantha]
MNSDFQFRFLHAIFAETNPQLLFILGLLGDSVVQKCSIIPLKMGFGMILNLSRPIILVCYNLPGINTFPSALQVIVLNPVSAHCK